jgi:hypothetical protein
MRSDDDDGSGSVARGVGTLVAVEADPDGSTRVHRRSSHGAKVDMPSAVRPYLLTSRSDLARAREVTALAEVTELPGEGLRHLLRLRPGASRAELLLAIETLTARPLRDDDEWYVPAPHECHLVESGERFFAHVDDADVRVGVVHLVVGREEPFVDANDPGDPHNVLVAAALHTAAGSETFTGAPAGVAQRLVTRIDALDVDVLVGFRLARVGLALLDASLRRVGQELNLLGGWRARIPGISIIDLESLCRDGDDTDAFDLADLARRRGRRVPEAVAAGPRVIAAARTDPWAAEDVAAESLELAARLCAGHLPVALHLARTLPVTLAEAAHRGPGALIERAITAEYQGVHALPFPSRGVRERGGGVIASPRLGRVQNVGHVDLSSAYPRIIAHRQIAPRSDVLKVFPRLVGGWLAARTEALEVVERGGHEAERAEVVQRALKRLANSAYGCLGDARFRFADHQARAGVAALCRDAAGAMRDALERQGAEALRIETDGIYYAGDLTADTARTVCEAAANQSIGGAPFRVRASRPSSAALFTSRVVVTTSGERKGWTGRKTSRFVQEVREEVIRSLLADNLAEALATIEVARQLLRDGEVPVEALATEHAVDTPPAISARGDGVLADLARAGFPVVHGDRLLVYRRKGENGAAPWTAWEPSANNPPYDPVWAEAELRGGLAILADLLLLEDLWAGRPPSTIPSRTMARATGEAHTHLVAGVKTVGRRTDAQLARYGDIDAEAAFLAANPDAHGLLLGYFGEEDARAPVGDRVRTGDFAMEFEDKATPGRALVAAQTALRELRAAGADLDRDLYAIFNGAESIVIRVRQAALGVENCVELPHLYRKFAASLWERVGQALGHMGAPLYDDELYGDRGQYRLVGVEHERTGGLCSYVSAGEILAAVSFSELREATPVARRPPAVTALPVLRSWFDEVTVDDARTVTHDPAARAPKPQSVARRQREREATRVHLRVVGPGGTTPCARAILDRAERGDHIGFDRLAKAVYELRALGWDRREIADRLAAGALGRSRYEGPGRLVLRGDGPDLSDDLWPDDPSSSYHRSCRSAAAGAICDALRCYRVRGTPTFDAAKSPSFASATSDARAAAATIEVPTEPGIVAYQVPPRSGKSTRFAKLAIEAANAGKRVLVAAQSHRALEEVAKYLREAASGALLPGKFAVQLLGRGAKRERCVPAFAERPHCHGCPNDVTVPDANGPKPNAKLATIRRRKRQIVDRSDIRELANGICCARSASMKLAHRAPIVLATHAHLLHDKWPGMLGGDDFDVVLVDEADLLLDELGGRSAKLVLARSRQSPEAPISAHCDRKCGECHLDFTDRPAVSVSWKGREQARSADANASPFGLIDSLDTGLELLRQRPELMPGVKIDRAVAVVVSLANALVEPSALKRGHHVAPAQYGRLLDEEHRRHPRADVGPSKLPPSDDPHLVLRIEPCVDDAPRDVDDTHHWRRRLVDEEVAEGLPAGDRRALDALADTLDFMDHAARVGDGRVLLVSRVQHDDWMTWRPWCSLELQTMDSAAIARVRAYLAGRRTVLASGTLPDAELLASLFPGAKQISHNVRLHEEVTVFTHCTQHNARAETFTPKRMDAAALVDLISRSVEEMRRAAPWRRALRVRVYARSIRERELLERAARTGLPGADVIMVDPKLAPAAPTRAVVVELDYLRSSTSRAVDVDCDVLIVFGSGYPAFDELHGTAESIAEHAPQVSVDTLAEDSRRRAVVQAMFRSAANPGRRVVVLVNDMTVADLPEHTHHRVVSADALYQTIESGTDIAAEQRARLARAVVESLVPPSPTLPTIEEILSWTPSGKPADGRMRKANHARLRAVLDAEERQEPLRAGRPLHGARGDWGRFLEYLAHRRVLARTGNTYAIAPGASDELGGRLGIGRVPRNAVDSG